MRAVDPMDRHAITALRVLSIDQVEQARSGHPGLPLGAAPMAWALWSRFLRHDPADPAWPDRDRFVLSAGHGSALLYSLLHLFGYELPLDELRRFRQWGSRTPGHPEHGLTAGVETTTGPLGQGLATAVGMAIAERHLAARFNRDGFPIFAHRTYVLASDGDMMEGISHEAASLAGHLGLEGLVVLYDDNRITIEGGTSLAFSEDVEARFSAYGWRTMAVEDGNDETALLAALERAAAADGRPTLIRIRTCIGFGAPTKAGTAECHGAPLGPEEAAATRRALGWPHDEPFTLPADIASHARALLEPRRLERQEWQQMLARYRSAHPELAAELERRLAGRLPDGLAARLPDFAGGKPMATREASGAALNALAATLPELLGGSADLAPSNNTLLKGETDLAKDAWGGRNLRFGVREHAMGAIANGLALHGGLRPYAGTFLIFSDYMRPAIRLAALMHQPVIYVFTHDSVALGEDGPTHQPIEHLAALRAIPNLEVMRPADAHETARCWLAALARRDGPTALVLTRQKLPVLAPPAEGSVERGAYIRAEAEGALSVVLLASGSEVSLALAARELLQADGIGTRVVSAPCLERLAAQAPAARHALLGGAGLLRVAIEMAHPQSWCRWVGHGGLTLGIERFGASAPAEEIARQLGFEPAAVAARVREALAARRVTPLAAAVPASLTPIVAGRMARLDSLHVAQRLEARDAALWGERAAKDVARRLGWLDGPCRTNHERRALEHLVAGLAADGASTLVLIGMGGSSLAPQVLRTICGNPSGRELVVLDTTDPERVGAVIDRLVPEQTAVLTVSKSGTTVETSALTEILWERMTAALGERAAHRFIALTEPGTALAMLARERHFGAVLTHPIDVGGRFSALTAVGAFPAIWLGLDLDALLGSGSTALAAIGPDHPGLELAAMLAAVTPASWGRLAWCASERLAPLGTWAEQLVAESTGKDGKGVLPILLERPPLPEKAWNHTLYLSPRVFGEDTEALDRALDALVASGHPVVRWRLQPERLGEAFAVLEVATAATGLLLGVNPFDEPDVVRAKDRARSALGDRRGRPLEETPDPRAALAGLLAGITRDDAVALLAYLPETDAVEQALHNLARSIGERVGVPVTAAFGPRYLHSTGQLHKGGPDNLAAIVLTSDPARNVPVPGRAFSLGELRAAQALGDLGALQDVGRRVLHLHLGGDVVSALEQLG